GDDHDILALRGRKERNAARELQELAERAGTNDARLRKDVLVDLVIARERTGMRGRRGGARGRATRLQNDDGLLLRDATRRFRERPPVLQILEMHGDDIGVLVL